MDKEKKQDSGFDNGNENKSPKLNSTYDQYIKLQIRKEGLRLLIVGLVWSFIIGLLSALGVFNRLLAFMHQISPILGLLIWFPAMAILIGGPYFLVVGFYQWIFGDRTRTAKKIYGVLRLEKESSSQTIMQIAEKIDKDVHLDREICPFCRGFNISEPIGKYNSLTEASECEACGAIWSPPKSKKYSKFVIAICVVLVPVASLIVFQLYKNDMPFISIFFFSLLALLVFGKVIYNNIMVLKDKKGQFVIHRKPNNFSS